MEKPEFIWPALGPIIREFSKDNEYAGIAFALPVGTDVMAAAEGKVAYSGDELKGYGNVILVSHGESYLTAYGHNLINMVKRGDRVVAGQVIAKSGQTGDADIPMLRFEIRKGVTPLDPIELILNCNSGIP